MPPSTEASSTRHGWLPRGRAGLRYRLGIASRTFAAIGAGYVLAALAAAVLALSLPASRAEATVTGTLVSFGVYAVAVMWVFAARSAARAWLGLLLPCAVLGLALLALRQAGGAS